MPRLPLHLLFTALLAAQLVHSAEVPPMNPQRKPNRLINQTSPYLLQHAHNPVDWFPWGPEALVEAKKQNKPIFLSVGYSTCHWCHVMERECFERDEVAAVLNEHFIAIKVDREERPDIDEQYMLATQLFTRRGGWPNSVFLTPDGRPFFAGTYFPRDRFIPLLQELARAWREQKPQVEQQADQFVAAIRSIGDSNKQADGEIKPLDESLIDQTIKQILENYDAKNGGFGSAPKFPPHGTLALLIHHQISTNDLQLPGVISRTLDAMAAGGIYDHLGGGFARYSTDSRWFLPHFEKMLYDNAQLIRAYADGWKITRNENYRRVIAESFDWLTREMTDPAGGFYSALDADSEGEEGKFYVWTTAELKQILGEKDAMDFAVAYGATDLGNFLEEATRQRTGANVLYLAQPPDPPAEKQAARFAAMKAKLLAARARRIRPHLDDKILSGWNGLMIGSLAHAGLILEEKRYIDAASKAADFVLGQMVKNDKLLRSWRKGEARQEAYLDDYAFLIAGLLDLHEATKDEIRLRQAVKLADAMIRQFHDAREGGFFFTSETHESLLLRAKELGGGGNIPSGNGVAASALIRLCLASGNKQYAEIAGQTLIHFANTMRNQPHGAESLILALAEFYEAAKLKPRAFVLRSPAPKSDADAVAFKRPAFIEAFASADRVAPGGSFKVAVRIKIDSGFHIYAHDIAVKTLIPTTLSLEPGDDFKLTDVKYPAGKTFNDPSGDQLSVYESTVTLRADVSVSPRAAPASKSNVELHLKLQACDDKACLAPEIYTLKIPVTIDSAAASAQARHSNVFNEIK